MDESVISEIKRKASSDFRFFCEKCLYVIDKMTNETTRFRFNRIQDYYHSVKSSFDIILKSRKGGISTYIIAEAVHKCVFLKNRKAVLLCQNDDTTLRMFRERLVPLVKNCLFPFRYSIKESTGEIKFPETNSTIYIGTAGTRTFGRGSDITDYHLSESAYYDKPDVITGIEEALLENACGRLETTANGINFFHKLWKESRADRSRYKTIFIPWFMDETYRISGVKALSDLTQDERDLMEVFGLDPEQIAWRRKKARDMSRPELIDQEYPSTAEQAFISSGKMVFDWIALSEYEKIVCEPKYKGFLRDEGEDIKFHFNSNSGLVVWDMPEQGHVYVIGADVAEGIKDGCYSTAFVLDVGNSSQVAEYHCHIPPDDFADTLVNLSRFYNNALLIPESWPGVGAVTTSRIIQSGYRNLFKRQKSPHSHKKDEQLYGWETTRRTKSAMIYSLAGGGIRELRLIIRSKGLLDELRSFVYNGDLMEPQEGCFSDRVIACAIAWKVAEDFKTDLNPARKIYAEIFHRAGSAEAAKPEFHGARYGVRKI